MAELRILCRQVIQQVRKGFCMSVVDYILQCLIGFYGSHLVISSTTSLLFHYYQIQCVCD